MIRLIAPAKRILELGQVSTPRLGSCAYQAYESNVDFETRFSVDNDVVGCNWIELLPGKYTRRGAGGVASKGIIEVIFLLTLFFKLENRFVFKVCLLLPGPKSKWMYLLTT